MRLSSHRGLAAWREGAAELPPGLAAWREGATELPPGRHQSCGVQHSYQRLVRSVLKQKMGARHREESRLRIFSERR